MKVINTSNEKPTLITYLAHALPIEKLAIGASGGTKINPTTFSNVIMLQPRGLFEDYGETIGGVVADEPNHIVIYDVSYLPIIKKLIENFELISEGIEVLVEVRSKKRGDYLVSEY